MVMGAWWRVRCRWKASKGDVQRGVQEASATRYGLHFTAPRWFHMLSMASWPALTLTVRPEPSSATTVRASGDGFGITSWSPTQPPDSSDIRSRTYTYPTQINSIVSTSGWATCRLVFRWTWVRGARTACSGG